MNLNDLKQKLPEIFEIVKDDVKKIYNRHRAGLRLGLAEIGMFQGGFIGGMHFYPGTDIIMNISPLKIILENTTDENIIWAYTYHILLHEYIHSLDVLDEMRCQAITLNISEKIFKDKKHPAVLIAENGIGYYIHNLQIKYVPPDRRPDGIYIEYLHGFDRESQSYFS